MPIFLDLLKLTFLFIALGWSADFAVKNIKYLGAVLKIRLFAFGILLGFITSLPELILGINASIDQVPVLSVGNLLGGIIVMLGLILGSSLLLNRKIITDGRLSTLVPTVAVIYSMVLFGLDGKYNLYDGLIMIGLYIGLIFLLYHLNHFANHSHSEIIDNNKIGKSIIFAVIGIIGVIITSHWILRITLDLLTYTKVSQLIVGLIVFSLGTNLPEISIAITSWRKKSSELSLSHLLSSSFTNVLILGILSLVRPIVFETDSAFQVVAIFFGVMLVFFAHFYHSDKKMDRREGVILFSLYILFILINLYLVSLNLYPDDSSHNNIF